MINGVLRELDGYTFWYVDVILIYARHRPGDLGTDEEHKRAVERVLKHLMNHDLTVNLEKSEFHVSTFLDNTLSIEAVNLKLSRAGKSPHERSISGVCKLLPAVYARRTKPLTDLTKGPTKT